jgi:hypothetical protein
LTSIDKNLKSYFPALGTIHNIEYPEIEGISIIVEWVFHPTFGMEVLNLIDIYSLSTCGLLQL